MKWGGVVSFFASEHAMRAERVLERADLPARLVPGPREVSPNCGVAVAFRWEDEPLVEEALQSKKIRFESIHRYELDDEEGTGSARVLSRETA
jgi:hypothetical protein